VENIKPILKSVVVPLAAVILVCMTIAAAMASTCYQESPITANQTGIDGNCGLIYQGSYTRLGGNLFAALNETYYKPPHATNNTRIKWEAGSGNGSYVPINYTYAPQGCWDFSPTELVIQIWSEKAWAYGGDGYIKCWDGSTWQIINHDGGALGAWGTSTGQDYSAWVDGNWSTYVLFEGYPISQFWHYSDFAYGDPAAMGNAIWETAIDWDIADAPSIQFTQQPPNISIFHNENISIQYNATSSLGYTSFVWGTNSTLFSINQSGYVFHQPTLLQTGVYQISINVTDNTSLATASFIYEIKNRAPTGGVLNITPFAPGLSESASCNQQVSITDPDSDPITYTYEWFKSGIAQGINTPTLASNYTGTSDQAWYCTLSATDGLATSLVYQSGTVVINSTRSQPVIDYTNATTAATGIASTATNPTNNNSYVNLSVNFHDANAENGWTAFYCRSPGFNGGCTGGEFCHSALNVTNTTQLSCLYTVSPETTDTVTYWVYVLDNTGLWDNIANSFHINFPPSRPLLVPIDGSWVNTPWVILRPFSNDINGDNITYYIYVGAPDNSTITTLINTSFGIPSYNWTGLQEGHYYYWQAKANDSHGYESDLSNIGLIGVDLTPPTLENFTFTRSLFTYETQTFSMSCSDSLSGVDPAQGYVNTTSLISTYALTHMIYLGNNLFKATFPTYGTTYYFDTWRCQDIAGNIAKSVSNESFTATVWIGAGGGGGGGGTPPPQSVINIIQQAKFCGDGVCNAYIKDGTNVTFTENPANCPKDCKVNFDNLVTCVFTDPKTCLYAESWFVPVLLIVIVLGGTFLILTQNKR